VCRALGAPQQHNVGCKGAQRVLIHFLDRHTAEGSARSGWRGLGCRYESLNLKVVSTSLHADEYPQLLAVWPLVSNPSKTPKTPKPP
jgi:hypothetical protein